MTTIWADVATALTGITIPKAADAFFVATGEALPDQYIVYSLVDGVPAQHADNAEKWRQSRVQISLYSRGGLLEADVAGIVTAMKAAGFTRGPDRALPYVASSRHFAVALDFYLAKEE